VMSQTLCPYLLQSMVIVYIITVHSVFSYDLTPMDHWGGGILLRGEKFSPQGLAPQGLLHFGSSLGSSLV